MKLSLGAILVLIQVPHCVIAQTQRTYEAQIMAAAPDASLNFAEPLGGFKDSVAGLVFAPSASGSVLHGQPSTLANRTAASLTYDAFLTAPNTSVGNYDWAQPWWAIVDLKANVTRSGYTRVELFSKGLTGSNLATSDATGQGYVAYLSWNANVVSACLNLVSATPAGHASGISQCSAIDVPDGYGLTIAFTYDGSGSASGINIYVNGQSNLFAASSVGNPSGSSMATPGYPLYLGGDANSTIAGSGTNIHNSLPTIFQAFAMGRGTLSAATIQSLVVHDRFYAQVLPPTPAVPKTIIWDNDGCQDTDNLNALATAIRLTQLGYLKLALVNNMDWSDTGAAMYRQMLDQAGLHHVPVSNSQGTWPTDLLPGQPLCTPAMLSAYNATYLPRARQMTDIIGYRTALAEAPDASVQMVFGGGFRGLYNLLQSPADTISPLTGAQLFTAKVTAIHLMAGVGIAGYSNLSEDVTGAAYVLANAKVPIYFYGSGVNFGGTGPGADVTRIQKYPFVATLVGANALTRASWDMWPLLGALNQRLFWDVGTPGTVALIGTIGGTTFSTATNSGQYRVTPTSMWADHIYMGTWFLNSLILANPEPPIVP